jgi:hypothetical protein
MSNFKLHIKSTSVDEIYGIVDLLLNDVVLVSNLQLSGDVTELEYEVDTAESYTLTVDLLNDRARDNNNDGSYVSEGDETMQAIVTRIEIADSEGNYSTILPQEEVIYIVPEGYVESGQEIELVSGVSKFRSFGLGYSIEFSREKILRDHEMVLNYSEIIGDSQYTNGVLVGTATPL